MLYHVLNRSNGRVPLFRTHGDYAAFEKVLAQAHEREALRLLAYCVMPNHWHMVVWPLRGNDRQVSEFLRWLTVTHTQRYHAFHGTAGSGHLYQGRFKSFPVQDDGHLLTVLGYVERNALRGKLVGRAEDWRWGSLWRRQRGDDDQKLLLSDWPVSRPRNWLARVNRLESDEELDALRRCVARGRPFGDEQWLRSTVRRLGLEHTMRLRGRPRKEPGSDQGDDRSAGD